MSPPEPEDTEDVLLTVAERLRTAGALAPLCCSPGGLQGMKKHRHQNQGKRAPEALNVHNHTFRNIWVTGATLGIKAAHHCLWL